MRTFLLAALAVVLAVALAAAVASAADGDNVVSNPGAEDGNLPAQHPDQVTGPRGWTANGPITTAEYGSAGMPGTAQSGEIAGGARLFTGGPCEGLPCTHAATQEFDLSASAGAIDAGSVNASLAAHMGGRDSDTDEGTVRLEFLSASSARLGAVELAPVTAADRDGQTRLLARSTSTPVPQGARRMRLALIAIASGGSEDGHVDAYFDNVSLSVAGAPADPEPIATRPPGDDGSGSGPTAPTTPNDPDARAPVPPARLSSRPVRMSRSGVLRLRVVCGSHLRRCSGRLYANVGRRRCGSARVRVNSGRKRLVRLRMGRKCRRLVSRSRRGRVVTLRLKMRGQPQVRSRLRVKRP